MSTYVFSVLLTQVLAHGPRSPAIVKTQPICLGHSLALHWPNSFYQLSWLKTPSVWTHSNAGFIVKCLKMFYVTQKLACFSSWEVIRGGESAVHIFGFVIERHFLHPWEEFWAPPRALASAHPIERSPLFLRFSWLCFSKICITLENGRRVLLLYIN